MKTRFFKTILALTLALVALPMMGQDFMNMYFKDGSHQKFFMPYVKELSSSKYDAEGNMHADYLFQHLITHSHKYIYDIAEIDSIAFTKCDESVDDSYGECYIDIPDEAGVRLGQLTILDDGAEVEASENGLLGRGLGDVIVFNGDNIVYVSYGEKTENRIVNAKETAVSLLLNVVPFAVTDLEGDGLWLFKQMIGHLKETRELADAIEQSIIKKGYLNMESIDSQYQIAVSELRSRLGLDDTALSRINEARRTKSTTYPLFLYGGKEAKGDGFSIIKESSVWGKAEKEEDGYCWKCNFTLLNADRWCYTGVTKMRKNEKGSFNRISTSLDGTFRYLVKPMNVSAFMDFGTLSDLATNPKEFLVTLSDPDFDRVISEFWEPLKNLGHIIKGEPTETTTFDKVKVEDIKFDLFPDNEHLGIIGPGTDSNLMLFNILKVTVQPIMKLMIKDIKKSNDYKKDRDYGDKLLVEFVEWIAETDLAFREEMLATFTDSSLPWTKRMEIIGEKTFKKFEKFLVEDIALAYVSEQVYKSFFGYLAKGYDDPQVKAIFKIYKTTLVAGDILLFAIDADYEGVAFEIDYGPSLENIQAKKETFIVNGVSFDMIHLTGGSFMMGASDDDKNATSNEKPLHAVTLSNFALGETEVTQALWETVMGSNPSKFKGANRPVENVTWLDCQEFITKLNVLVGRSFRLPTEAEWEYAATGGLYSRGFLYAGSNDIDKVAWYNGNSEKETHPVKQKQCNEFGFYDMSGNVFEWCQDFYDVNYYDHSPDVDPCNDITATLYKRVLRGGCWHWDDVNCRVSSRSNNGQGVNSEIFGLRLAISDSFTDTPAEARDLGLPSGTKWASYNVGATAPEEYGEYFAWGELKEKDTFNESNYQFCKNGIYANIGDDIGGTEYDVARDRWGGNWVIPNKKMMQELYENCSTKWTTLNGVYGMEFTGPNGNTLFLPAAGFRKDDQQLQAGVWGDYWASTVSEANTYSAYELYFKNGLINCDYIYNDNPTYRRNGHTVRPVIPGLQLTSNGPLSILMGDSETVGVRYGSGSYRYEVDKEGIVSVDITGSTISINALSGGNVVITVIDNNGGKANISVAVKALPEAKDLGLPSGTKWATFNIGANKPEDYGEYYAWGENGVKGTYNESTYEYCKNGMYTKIGNDIRGTQYDTAREKWGGEWMMPSTTQFNELIANCTTEWVTLNGVKGRKFTSKINGEYIFFPAAGYYGSKVGNNGSNGYYWSGIIDPENGDKAYNLSVKNGTPSMVVNSRFNGFSVRPVISGLELSIAGTLSMFESNSKTVTVKSGSGSYQLDVDKEGIVSASIIGTTITINALTIGDVVFTVTDTNGGQKANIKINVRAVPKAIDLGLPSGTKWANVNVGANSPEEFGDYFAWGETEPKSVYTTSTYKHYKSSSYVDIGYDIRGSEYDAVRSNWGDKWLMPSSAQINELIENCTSEWTTLNGVYGRKFISKINGDSIFLPAVGYCENGVSSSGTSGYYWACDRVPDNNKCGYSLDVKKDAPTMKYYTRYYGFAVRPVIRENVDDPRMDEVIPEIIRDKFRDYMPIYSGTNPPIIEGSYLIEPYTTIFCEDGHYAPGRVIDTYKIKFINQSTSDNTIDMIEHNVDAQDDFEKGTGAFISGDGTHFTAYFSTEGMAKNIRTKKSVVISGTKTDNGIENIVYGFVMVDKGSDPDNKLMKIGVFRAFKDGDGISEPTTWEFESSARQMDSKNKPESETMVDAAKPIKTGTKQEESQIIK